MKEVEISPIDTRFKELRLKDKNQEKVFLSSKTMRGCIHCGRNFNPRVKGQRYCSNKSCQRARRARWQRNKIARRVLQDDLFFPGDCVNQVIKGECLEVMKQLPSESVDLIVTDPPYGISFMGKEWDKFQVEMTEFFVPVWKECLRILNPGSFAFIMSFPRQDVLYRQILALQEADFKIEFSSIYWTYASGFCKARNIGNMVAKRFGRERASELEGSYSGFQPKPAIEIILVAMKPLCEKTYVGQALKNKKGVTWLDDCKISSEKDRVTANLLVSDDVLNDGENHKNKTVRKGYYQRYDKTGFSRFFSLDNWWKEKVKDLPESVRKTLPFLIVPKASRKEKDRGLEQFKDKILARSGGAQQAIKKGHQEYLQDHIGLNRITKVKNDHPTCKPIKLMSYLISLGSRKGDLVLDPFVGSGTTCISAKMLNRRFIGIEKEKDYVEIAKARLISW